MDADCFLLRSSYWVRVNSYPTGTWGVQTNDLKVYDLLYAGTVCFNSKEEAIAHVTQFAEQNPDLFVTTVGLTYEVCSKLYDQRVRDLRTQEQLMYLLRY